MKKLIIAVCACFILAFTATSADARVVVSIDGGHYRHHHYYYTQPSYSYIRYVERCYVNVYDEYVCYSVPVRYYEHRHHHYYYRR